MINDGFMLQKGGKTAEMLYHNVAKNLPVIDFHNHLSVTELSKNERYENITKLWLTSDPYKHRAMRICGVEEKYITGNATDKEKFIKWCSVFGRLVGNPIYHWSLLELKRVFDTDISPSVENAEMLWDYLNRKLWVDIGMTPSEMVDSFNVEYSAPCAVPTDDLSVFCGVSNTYPSMRADELLSLSLVTVKKLGKKTGVKISGLDSFYEAVELAVYDFQKNGCRFSDHAIDNGFRYFSDDGKNDARIKAVLDGCVLDYDDNARFCSHILRMLGDLYAKYGWTAQYHIGAQRTTSTRLRSIAGKAGGYAAIGNNIDISAFTSLFDDLEKGKYGLSKTLIFTLDPSCNAAFSTLSGSYSKDGVPALVSQGPAWWWCDHALGMREVFDSFASYGVLSEFVGMTTDSRSILSFSRHEYFRRVFCSYVGEKVMNGEFPSDEKLLSELVYNVCYGNAKRLIKQ